LAPGQPAGYPALWYAGPAGAADHRGSLPMPFLALHVVLSFLLDLAHVLTRRDHDQALELVLLRQQLRLYERTATQPRPSRWEKAPWPPSPPSCPTWRGWPSSSGPPRCCAGIARLSSGNGPSTTARNAGGRRSRRPASSSSCAWHARLP